jgi:5-methylcytosine-specific restriction endonuclease McrA
VSFDRMCRIVSIMARNSSRHHFENPWATADRTASRASHNFTAAERDSISFTLMKRDGHGCFYCKKALSSSFHIDHKVPVNRGGESELGNYVLACMQCNQEKHAKTIDEYRRWLLKGGEKANF